MIWAAAVFWGMCAVASAVIASSKSRDPIAWFGISLVTGIFGLIMVAAMPAPQPAAAGSGFPLVGAGRRQDGSSMECPDCHESVSVSARTCSHCGYRLA